jgi:hypothetical protein
VRQPLVQRQRRVDVAFDVDVAGDVRAPEAELAGRPDDSAQRGRGADDDTCAGVGRAERGTVVEFDRDRQIGAERRLQERGQPVRRPRP